MINEVTFLRATDTAYALRFLRLLTMPVEKTKAFKLNLIDNRFKTIKKATTSDEKAAYTIFHRLVFNIRRLLVKVPGGRIANYAAALYLLKEKFNLSEEDIESAIDSLILDNNLVESNLFINSLGDLMEGQYILNKDLILPLTGEDIIKKGSKIKVSECTQPCGNIFDIPVFKVYHEKTKQKVYITQGDIQDA
tara:strand:- start:794 stop:1372 length:579 start_codon:yes stop_codon:yes gene_type:complete